MDLDKDLCYFALQNFIWKVSRKIELTAKTIKLNDCMEYDFASNISRDNSLFLKSLCIFIRKSGLTAKTIKLNDCMEYD